MENSLEAVRTALSKGTDVVGPSQTGRFPYIHHTQLWPFSVAEELIRRVIEEKDPKRIDSILRKYVDRYPFLVAASRLILWHQKDENLRDIALDILMASGNPKAHEEVRQFATSQNGSDHQRMDALMALRKAGQIEPNEIIRFWSEEKEEWGEILLYAHQIVNTYEAPCHPGAIVWVNRSNQVLAEGPDTDKVYRKAIQSLRKALAIDNNCVIALHNLGSIYLRQGKVDEGESLIRKSVEIDPNYLFGYTSLAAIELEKGNLEACHEHIEHIFSAPEIPASTYARVLAVQMRMAIEEEDPDAAERILEMLKEFDPDYPGLATLEEQVEWTRLPKRFLSRWLEDVHRYRERQLKKPILKDEDLAVCLDRISLESLKGTLRAWGLPISGRKAEVIRRLVETMLDPETLNWFIEGNLSQKEHEALAWMIENEGIRPWEDFTQRHGDDYDESPYWQYHKPETIAGRLRMFGLVAVGTTDGQKVALIPRELRPLLRKLFNE